MNIATHTTASHDGRTLSWVERGDPAGAPVFLFHGTPGSRYDWDPWDHPTSARVIVPDRPGYGRADPRPGRTVLDWADDVATIADSLGLDRFDVVGISGGGPHALACAVALGSTRVRRVGTLCGLGPTDWDGATDGMQPMNVMFNELARTDPDAVYATGDAMAAMVIEDFDAFSAMTAADWPPIDAAVCAEPEAKEMMRASFTEAVRQGGRAFAEEMIMFARPWGFALEDVRVPVLLWHGTDDRNVPVSHAHYMAGRLPHATLRILDGEGHMSLAFRYGGEFLAALQAP